MSKRIIIFVLFGLLAAAQAPAQLLPRCGTHFTFGIPEGPDALLDPILGTGTSVLSVNILSHEDGKGIITSPNGYCHEFTFTANTVTTVELPYSFMHLKDLGKTNKGLLIRTTQPVNVVFHDFLEEAGEATQIYPDEALDTNYRISSWGLYDDPTEDNHTQFVITATQDNTDITIIPTVQALGNHPAGIPIKATLNRGECYVVKADITGVPVESSLSNSIVRSTKPVSIIAGVTCGYTPLGVESCNELLDEVLPRKLTDTIFYVAPLQDTLVTNTLLFTSDSLDFWVIPANGGSSTHSTNGRAVLQLSRPGNFSVTQPAQCFLLSEGSDLQLTGDPSIVTVLPRNQYVDTMIWYTPPFISLGAPFANFVSVIYPKISESSILLDGLPIASVATPRTIVGSAMHAAVASIRPGVHQISSPVPVFVTASGFMLADAYSFMPGTIAPKLPEDTLPASLVISSTPAKTCRTFDLTASTNFRASDGISSVNLTLTYDPNLLTVVSVNLGSVARGGTWTADARIPGTITISASCLQPFTDSGALAIVTFSTGPSITTTAVTGSLQEMGGENLYGALAGFTKDIIDIKEIRDTLKASFTLNAGAAYFGRPDTATVRLTSIPGESVNEIDLYVSYNHNLLFLEYADLRNTLIPGITTIVPTNFSPSVDEIRILLPSSQIFTTQGVIARLIFETFVSDSMSGNISLDAVVGNTRPCPLDIIADQVSSEFTGSDTCGSQYMRALLLGQPFTINSIIPNPSNGSFTIDLDRHLFGEPLQISLIDLLGNEVWSTFHSSPDIHQKIPCTIDRAVPGGTYLIRIAGSGKTVTQKIIIRN